MKNIKEDLVHYIWKTKSFDQSDLRTTDHKNLTILSFGTHNGDAGPDFLNARIELDNILWAGHIEIHIRASDWLKHQHQLDVQYQNVILHVVLEADLAITLMDKTPIPCLELKDRINHRLISRYQYLNNNKAWIPCESLFPEVNDLSRRVTLDRSLTQRLIGSTNDLKNSFNSLEGNWSELIYHRLAWSFGLKVNAIAMQRLAQSLPLKVIQKHRDNLFQVEALLFGQSGLLPEDDIDEYVKKLRKEYLILKTKFNLKPLAKVLWKFSRLRPASFPTIRISQLAQYLHQNDRIDESIFNIDVTSIHQRLTLHTSSYWQDHYRFGNISASRRKTMGAGTRSIIIINAIVPILFTYGQLRKNESYKEKAISLLESLPPEHNHITKRWTSLGMRNENAADSQALIQLKKAECDLHNCLTCPIGHQIVTTDKE